MWLLFWLGGIPLLLGYLTQAWMRKSLAGVTLVIGATALQSGSIALWYTDGPGLEGEPDILYLGMMCFVSTCLGYACWLVAACVIAIDHPREPMTRR